MANIQDTESGKMSPDVFQAMDGVIIKPCLKRSHKVVFQCLNLGGGQPPVWYEATALISLGSFTMPAGDLGLPKDGKECFLSQILQKDVPKKYSLSPKACAGILRRASMRGKALPPLLKAALEAQSAEYTESAP